MAKEEIQKDTVTSLTEYSGFKKSIAKNPALMSGYSKLLKSAGYYKGPITTKYTPAFQKALDKAEEDRLSIAAIRPVGRDEFLKEKIDFGTGGSGKAGTYKTTAQINDTAAAALINSIVQDLQDQDATPQQIAKYTQQLRKAQAANPTKTTYDAAGNSIVTGGIDTQQFLTEKIKSTPEAKTNRATDAYSIMMQELGGLR